MTKNILKQKFEKKLKLYKIIFLIVQLGQKFIKIIYKIW